MARRCEFYVLVARTISHSFAAATHEHKIHVFPPPCNILDIFWLLFMHTFTTGSHKDGNINDSLRNRSEGCGGRRTRAWKEGAETGTEKERGVGQRMSAPGSCSRRSFPFFLAFFLTYFIHAYTCNLGYTYYNNSQPSTSRRRIRIVLSISCLIVSFTMM